MEQSDVVDKLFVISKAHNCPHNTFSLEYFGIFLTMRLFPLKCVFRLFNYRYGLFTLCIQCTQHTNWKTELYSVCGRAFNLTNKIHLFYTMPPNECQIKSSSIDWIKNKIYKKKISVVAQNFARSAFAYMKPLTW